MQSDDVFRRNLEKTKSALRAWAKSVEDVAVIDVRDTPAFFDITANPHAAGASPFGLVLRQDQRFDLAVANEVFADREISDFDFFAKLATAVTDGHVAQVLTSSALTGLPLEIETRAQLDDGTVWTGARTLHHAATAGEQTEQRIRAFLPYRRG